ncbi:MAG: FMN-binding protein [Cuneatibacter sp.]|nr:FMN-binding protein [Cuneatibacter sp.]
MNRRKKKTVLIVISALLVIGIFAGGLYLKSISDYKAKVDALTFDEIDLTKVEDGVYEGQCDTGVVRARVQVTVRDHRLESIELLEHENGRGAPAEAILAQMVEEQTTAVDAVSGATCSSKVIRKAVENALSAGLPG